VDLKSKREAAEILGISTRGVERAVRRGQLQVQYRDSKHGRKAWFRPADLNRYKLHQQTRNPVGFSSGIAHSSDKGLTIGTVTPVVEADALREHANERSSANTVPLSERLTLTVSEAAQLSGLPHSFLTQSIEAGKLKSIRIGRRLYLKRAELILFVQQL